MGHIHQLIYGHGYRRIIPIGNKDLCLLLVFDHALAGNAVVHDTADPVPFRFHGGDSFFQLSQLFFESQLIGFGNTLTFFQHFLFQLKRCLSALIFRRIILIPEEVDDPFNNIHNPVKDRRIVASRGFFFGKTFFCFPGDPFSHFFDLSF